MHSSRFAARVEVPRDIWRYALATAVGATIWIWPHLLHLRQVPDRGDPVFSAWRLARFARQLLTDPRHLFDGNIFHPLPLTLTYSDPTALQGLLATPLIVLGLDPLVAANLLFLAAFPACGLAFFYAGWRLTLDPRAGMVAGLLGAWYPFHGEHYSHLELQWFMFVPLAFIAALRMLAQPGWRTGLALGAAVGAQWLASMYVGLMLVSVLLPFAAVVAVGWRIGPSASTLRAGAAAAAVAFTAGVFTGIPTLRSREARGDRSPEEVALGSALVSDYARTHRRMAAYSWHSRAGNVPERELFPGVSTLALAAAGLWPPAGTVRIALAASGALAFEWSRGLNAPTYRALYRWLPAYKGIRVPARFSVILGSVLVLLGAFGAQRILAAAGSPAVRTALVGMLAAAVLFDLRLRTPLVDYWPEIPGVYQRVTPDMVLAEFPAGSEIHSMYFSTAHWGRLAGGYSGFIPRDGELAGAVEAFPSRSSLDVLRRRGTTHLTYNCAFERSVTRCEHNQRELDASGRLELIGRERWLGSEVRLYRFLP